MENLNQKKLQTGEITYLKEVLKISNILGIKGLSTPNLNVLVAAYGNDIINLATGLGGGLNLSPNFNVEFESFLGSLFFQNGVDRPLTSSNGNTWTTKHVARPPLGLYLKAWRSRSTLYVGNVTIQGVQYPSKVMFSALPNNNTIQWGYEYGNNLVTHAGNPNVSAAGAGFKTFQIQRGDSFFILTGNDIGEYKVISVNADQQITLDKPLTTEASGTSYWVGGNWFDVGPDDGDFITWMEENNDFLMVYKRDSLYRINTLDGSNKTKVRGAYGTTSGRSVINLHELSIYYHNDIGLAKGFYAYNGGYSQKISAPIENHIAGISPAAMPVAWREGELYRCYVGNIVNLAQNINIPNAVVTWDYETKAWSIDPIDDVPVCSTEFRQALTKMSYFGTNSDSVMVTPSGNTYNGKDIPFNAETGIVFPFGSSWIGTFYRLQIFSRNMKGIQVQYKRAYQPFRIDQDWQDLGEIKDDRTELFFPLQNHQMAGIKLRFLNMSATSPEGYIEKVTMFVMPKTTVIQQ